ncbi:Os10g0410100 [Oryza sativa Japonica Group]|uniref:Os10g0410100 protein n=2 Tax=Oryza sativa subsp. japonica TaxID=39947 RepID=Q0IXS6_ORYSJ|nr:hypothetical protein EE612_051398 [Oryza sativa]BAF26489.1 Os10g0410100 [Oryza sativa Japonica Group]BAT10802.1 Os10g0410100 [Oryza sativa Japonica Group]|eukprot:NP_001064575.1 Os10g0410100 [Oryza sativa Japonica Group]
MGSDLGTTASRICSGGCGGAQMEMKANDRRRVAGAEAAARMHLDHWVHLLYIFAVVIDPPFQMHLAVDKNMETRHLELQLCAKIDAFSCEISYGIDYRCTRDWQNSI